MVWFGLDDEEYDRQYSDRVLLKRVSQYLHPYRKQISIVIVFLTLSSISSALLPWLSSILINTSDITQDLTLLIGLIIISFGLNILSWIFNYIRQINSVKILSGIVFQLQQDAQNAVLNQDFYFFDHYPIGKLVSRINSDTRSFGEMADLFMESISSFFVVVFIFIPMFFINQNLSFLLLLIIPVIFIIALSFRKIARKRTLMGQRSLAQVNNFVQESMSGIQITKTFRQEQRQFDKFNKINSQSFKVNLSRAMALNFLFPSMDLVWGILIGILIFLGGGLINSNLMTPGDLYLFLQSAWSLFFPIFSVAAFWPQFQSGLSAGERVFALIDAPHKVNQNSSEKMQISQGKIEFDHLTFEYVPGKPIFNDFTLTIQPGESIAIVGHTGAGKSTLAKLIARFYEFQSGDLRIDGSSVRDLDLSIFRKQIGYIPQSPFLWATSLEDNVKYGQPLASREEILNALDLAGGSDWIEELTENLDTDVNERGKMLSMGQRQLVAFARILLAQPRILILDEATASVDPFTETKIQDALETTMKGRTSIIIAHRLWTVRKVDRIIVLDHGKIVEQGSHDNLMRLNGAYAQLYNTYFKHQSFEFMESLQK